MRATWRAMTARGRTVLLVGAVAALLALALGQRDLLRAAVLAVALPLVAWLVTTRRNDSVAVSRTLEPGRVAVGGRATVRLRVSNSGTRTSGPLHVWDHVDESLGTTPRLVLERLDPGQTVETTYDLVAAVRGHHRVGPLSLYVEDPFGLARAHGTSVTAHTLTVTPLVSPLRSKPLSLRADSRGDGAARRTSSAGHDDVGTREYRVGDELRRVHWRSTARTGALMVRQEEAPWEGHTLLVLDTRVLAHVRATKRGPVDVTSSSFEWAVHAAASVGAHLAGQERKVRLLAGHHDVTVADGRAGALLDVLAGVRPSRDGVLVPSDAPHAAAPLVVAVLGAGDAPDLAALQALRTPAAACVAIVLDTPSWSASATGVGPDPATDLAAPFRAAGWHAATASRGDDVADVWNRATR